MNLVDNLIMLDSSSHKLILVVGDGMTDVYVNGHIEECQEKCPKFIEKDRIEVPGGAANAARSLSNWNVRVSHVFDYKTGPIKVRFMVNDTCVWRFDNDRKSFDASIVRDEIMNLLHRRTDIDAVLISDYDKGLLSPEFLRKVINFCNEEKIHCVADVKREPELYKGAITKGNEQWFCKFRTAVGLDVLTRGGDPPYVYPGTSKEIAIGSWGSQLEVPCVNHVGAGDCFAAHLTLALVYGFSLKEAAAVAHSAGRVYVQHRHNRPPEPNDIRRDFARAYQAS